MQFRRHISWWTEIKYIQLRVNNIIQLIHVERGNYNHIFLILNKLLNFMNFYNNKILEKIKNNFVFKFVLIKISHTIIIIKFKNFILYKLNYIKKINK